MRVLGVDPGTAICGYGVVESQGSRLRALAHGCVRTSPSEPLAQRLLAIHDKMRALIEQHAPHYVAVEQLFFNRNAQSALAVGHARGVVLLAAAERNLPVLEFTPQQVKSVATGHGGADKAQMQAMVRVLLNLPEVPHPDDVADALAVAICGTYSQPLLSRLEARA